MLSLNSSEIKYLISVLIVFLQVEQSGKEERHLGSDVKDMYLLIVLFRRSKTWFYAIKFQLVQITDNRCIYILKYFSCIV